MDRNSLTANRARELFEYNVDTGMVRRKGRGKRVAPTSNGDGYARTTADGVRYYIHRLVWLIHYGEWPKFQVDHIDGDRANNRISNLRDVDHTTNAQNVHIPKGNNKLLGVTYDKQRKKFKASISIGPRGSAKAFHLGRYETEDQAHQVYLTAKRKMHQGFAM